MYYMEGQCDIVACIICIIIVRIFALTVLPYPLLKIIQHFINYDLMCVWIVSGFRKLNLTAYRCAEQIFYDESFFDVYFVINFQLF